jgi:hypothetical protein
VRASYAIGGVVAVIALLVLAAACGGNDSGGPGPLTASAWRSEANAICRRVNAKIGSVPHPPAEYQGADFAAASIPLWNEEQDAIAALDPPPELEEGSRAYVHALEDLLKALVEIQISAQRADVERHTSALGKKYGATVRAREAATTTGLTACVHQDFP